MDSRHLLSASLRHRAGKIGIAIVFVAAAAVVGGLAGLLLVMAALVPLGAAIANVKILPGARDTWRCWHPVEARRTSFTRE